MSCARSSWAILPVLACLFAWVTPAATQPAQGKVTKLVVPLTAGSPIDVLARLYAPALSEALGATVIVENKPGAGTTLGARSVASAEPDGATLLVASTSHPISAAIYKKLPYDPFTDFAAVTPLASIPWVIVISSDVPAKTLQDFIAYAKANPGKMHFGFGYGTAPHIIGEAFKHKAGIDIASIPYKGGAQVVPDMLGGRIQMNIGTPSTLLPLIREGKLRAIAVTSRQRVKELPDVTTLGEAGISGLPLTNWAGILAPKNTPPAVVDKLNAAVTASSRRPETVAHLTRLGFDPEIASPRQFAEFLDEEKVKWKAAVAVSGVQPQ